MTTAKVASVSHIRAVRWNNEEASHYPVYADSAGLLSPVRIERKNQMIQVAFSCLALAASSFPAAALQGQLPLIVQDADTLESGGPTVSGTVSLSAIDDLQGGDFGAAVIDLNSGEVLASTGSGIYPINDPDVILLAYAVELMQSGVMPPDSVVGRNITIRDEFWWAFRGDRESAARVMWTLGLESASAWALSKGFTDTELHDVQLDWEGAPETDPSLSSLSDIVEALRIIHGGIDIPAVREIMGEPDMGDAQASSVGEGWDLYGWVDAGSEHKTFLMIARSPDGMDLGLVVLTRDLCCEQKGDLAMMLLWEAALAAI